MLSCGNYFAGANFGGGKSRHPCKSQSIASQSDFFVHPLYPNFQKCVFHVYSNLYTCVPPPPPPTKYPPKY